MKTYKNGLLTIVILISITGAALAYMGVNEPPRKPSQLPFTNGSVSVDAALAQNKVLVGSHGQISLSLTLRGEDIAGEPNEIVQPVDLVVVIDRSGSMRGQKISDAKQAVVRLLDRMSGQDRISIVTYSNGVEVVSPLTSVTDTMRRHLKERVTHLQVGGGTNLGGGLERGISMLGYASAVDRQRKVVLLSDGLANQGIRSPQALGAMAGRASEHNMSVSSVGVGYDFNEMLMTTIADHGAGNYYFLEDPQSFAQIFEKEFETARAVVASNVEVAIPLSDGIRLISAGGYPFKLQGTAAVIRPGNLLAGQSRQIFLTFQVPTAEENTYLLDAINVHYMNGGIPGTASTPAQLRVACVENEQEVIGSIDEKTWSEQVIREDYSRLKEDVATAIRSGKKEEAIQAIEDYTIRNQTLNSVVQSEAVSENLDKDVSQLKQSVNSTFSGAPAAVAAKRKQQAKVLQYEGYQVRRDKK